MATIQAVVLMLILSAQDNDLMPQPDATSCGTRLEENS
jgi:hypothetical protein